MEPRAGPRPSGASLLGEVARQDPTLPTKLPRLLVDTDAAHYSPSLITVDKAKAMVRHATALLAEAEGL